MARLLNFARRTEPERRPFELHGILHEAIALADSQIGSDFVVVQKEFIDADVFLEVDRIQIQQVVVNLLQNACQALAMRPTADRRVTIGTADHADVIEISVTDNGPGFANATATRLFEPFFTTRPEGSGMGLAISKSIIEAHGGRVWATSNPGAGAAFHFTIPKSH
jgi:two-component system sensor kinase FixL